MGKTRKQRIKNNSRAKTIKNNKNLLSNEQDMEGGYGVIQHGGETKGAFDAHYKIIQNNDGFKTIRAFLRQISLFFFRGRYFNVIGYSKDKSKYSQKMKVDPGEYHPVNKYRFFMKNDNISDIGESHFNGMEIAIEDYLSMLQSVVGMSSRGIGFSIPYGVLGDRFMTQLSRDEEKRFKEFRKIFYPDSAELYGPHEYEYEYLDETNILNYIIEQLKNCLVGDVWDDPTDNKYYGMSLEKLTSVFDRILSPTSSRSTQRKRVKVLLYWYTGYAHALTELACRLLFPLNDDGIFDLNKDENLNTYFSENDYNKRDVEETKETINNIHINNENASKDPPSILQIAKLATIIINYHSVMTERTVQFKGEGAKEMSKSREPSNVWSRGNQIPKIILMMRLFRFVCFQGDTSLATMTSSDKTGTSDKKMLTASSNLLGKRFDSGTIRMNNRINEAATQLYLNQDIKINALPSSPPADPTDAPDKDLDESLP
tara:strand:- start:280 stop:1737 length:1458 start_codon:yes stop_codon:yes gene_type:complete